MNKMTPAEASVYFKEVYNVDICPDHIPYLIKKIDDHHVTSINFQPTFYKKVDRSINPNSWELFTMAWDEKKKIVKCHKRDFDINSCIFDKGVMCMLLQNIMADQYSCSFQFVPNENKVAKKGCCNHYLSHIVYGKGDLATPAMYNRLQYGPFTNEEYAKKYREDRDSLKKLVAKIRDDASAGDNRFFIKFMDEFGTLSSELIQMYYASIV